MISLKIMVSALTVSSVLAGAENSPEKYIQDKYKLSPNKAGALSVYSQVKTLDCQRPATKKDLIEFEGTKTFKSIANENTGKGPIGFNKLRIHLKSNGEKITC